MAICGIYKYENLINGKIYIGQSIDISQRKREHKYDAFTVSRNDNTDFHKDLREFGEDNFKFDIIEECSIDELDERERYWIFYYHTYIKDPLCKGGYNMTPGGDSGTGESFRKPVCQYDLKGNFIQEFESASEAARQLSVFKSNITSACRGESSQCGGYQWKYKDDDKEITKINFIGKRLVEKYNFLGELLDTYDNALIAAQQNNICHQSITACCRGEMNFAGEFQWKYKDDNKEIKVRGKSNGKPVGQYDKNGNLIKIYPSYSAAERETSINRNRISRAIGKKIEVDGYYWDRIGG